MAEIQWFEEARQVSGLILGARRRSVTELMRQACEAADLEDFGPEPIEEPLARLLAAYKNDRRLSSLGRLAAKWDVMRLLRNRLILRDRELRDPAVLDRKVKAPLIITGLPRSGTSFLHRLLAQDPNALTVSSWQLVYPYPDHWAAGPGAGPDRVQSEFSLFGRISPELMKIHPQHALFPQECGEITAHSFRSLRFDATYDTPSYRQWLRGAGSAGAYRLHRRFLKHLQGERRGRWVLKWPDHVFALADLKAQYPDARVIFSHRDPAKALPSLARLTEVLRRPFVRKIEPLSLGEEVVASWTDGTERMRQACAEETWPARQTAHVRFLELVADPVATVRRLYGELGLPFTIVLEARLRDYVAGHPRDGYGVNVYDPARYGMRAEALRERLSDYIASFGVEPEPDGT
ncbi:MAG: sulfotransferase family protein [Caulobacteraceae bacterium]